MAREWNPTTVQINRVNEFPIGNMIEPMVRESLHSDIHCSRPEDLITHTVFLSDDQKGPSVHVYGRTGEDAFYAEYHAETVWVRETPNKKRTKRYG